MGYSELNIFQEIVIENFISIERAYNWQIQKQ
jgi:hypothetical protein